MSLYARFYGTYYHYDDIYLVNLILYVYFRVSRNYDRYIIQMIWFVWLVWFQIVTSFLLFCYFYLDGR